MDKEIVNKEFFESSAKEILKVRQELDAVEVERENALADISKQLLVIAEPFNQKIEGLKAQHEKLVEDIKVKWAFDEKTLKFSTCSITRAELRILEVFDKDMLVDELIKHDIIKKAVKMFDMNFLKTTREAMGWLEDSTILKSSYAIKVKEEKHGQS